MLELCLILKYMFLKSAMNSNHVTPIFSWLSIYTGFIWFDCLFFFLLKKGAISNFKFFSLFFEKILGIFVPGPGPVSTGTTRSLWKKFSTCTRSRSLWKFHRVHVSGRDMHLYLYPIPWSRLTLKFSVPDPCTRSLYPIPVPDPCTRSSLWLLSKVQYRVLVPGTPYF